MAFQLMGNEQDPMQSMMSAIIANQQARQAMTQNQYLSPELRALVQQQQQKALQMQAQTPYAAQMASNQALSAAPTDLIKAYLQNPKAFTAAFPGLAEQIQGYTAQQFARNTPPPQSGTQPTKPLPLGATTTTDSSGNSPGQEAPTWYGQALNLFESPFKGMFDKSPKPASGNENSNQFTANSAHISKVMQGNMPNKNPDMTTGKETIDANETKSNSLRETDMNRLMNSGLSEKDQEKILAGEVVKWPDGRKVRKNGIYLEYSK